MKMVKLMVFFGLFCSLCFGQSFLQNKRKHFQVTPPSGGCPADGSPTFEQDGASDWASINGSGGAAFSGQVWSNSVDRTICKLGFKTGAIIGDVSAKTFYVYVRSMSGANLGTVLATGTSTGIAANSWNVFELDSAVLVSANTLVGLVITMDGANDVSNYVNLRANFSGSIDGYINSWSSDGTSIGFSNHDWDTAIRIYCQ